MYSIVWEEPKSQWFLINLERRNGNWKYMTEAEAPAQRLLLLVSRLPPNGPLSNVLFLIIWLTGHEQGTII
jgi:hypothetical protein